MAEKIKKKNIAEACEEYIKIFGANKNLYRIMPNFADGLKPSGRRFLYSLYRGKGRTQFIKMSKAAADTTADFHPHGSAAVEDTGAKLASPIANNIAVVEGQGNFGSYKMEKAGASRYIECRLSKYALKCFFEDFNDSCVDMKPSYTGDLEEPEFLPARYPHALFNPQLSGIGFAFASNIPPFNLTEVMETTINLIKNPKAKVYLIPDSPTGADVVDDGQFKEINKTGKGTFTLRGSVEIDEINNIITITSIPLQVTIDRIIQNIVSLREKKVFDEITDIKDYTKNETGVKCKLFLTPSANPQKTVEKLYSKGTELKKTYPVGIRLIDDYKDRDYGIKSFLLEWIEYRRDIVRSSYNGKLVDAIEQQNINDVMLFISNADNAETTIGIIKSSANTEESIKKLMKKYKQLNSQQAAAIAEMKLSKFTKEAHQAYKDKRKKLIETIENLEDILQHDEKIDAKIIEQLEEGIKLFGSPRKSKVVMEKVEDDIPDTEHIVGISKDGYIKKVSADKVAIGQIGETRSQYTAIRVNNRDNLLIFDSTGYVTRIPVSTIANMKPEDTGIMLERFFKISGKIVSPLVEPNTSDKKSLDRDLFIVFLTKKGFVKKVNLDEFTNINGSKVAINISAGDELVATEFVFDNTTKDMIIFTSSGSGIRRDINEFSVMKPAARGTKQITLSEDESCVGFSKISPDKKYLLYVTSSGRMKVTATKYLPTMKKHDEVISLINLEDNDRLVGISSVDKTEKVNVYKKKSDPEQIDLKDLPVSTRAAKADKVVKTPRGEVVLAYTVIK